MITELLLKPTNEATLWVFLRSLAASKLLPDSEVEFIRREFPAENLNALYDELVGEGKLTPYQMQRIKDGKPHGLVLGQYRILDILGQGGFGCVYKARHTIMDRLVALKIVAPEWVEDKSSRDLFLREMVASTMLVHQNIALAYDANEIEGELFLAMEFIEGPTLEKHVKELGPLSVGLASAVACQTAQALAAAHQRGMVHRDIKPANIMLPGVVADSRGYVTPTERSPLVKIVDFGLARLYPHGTHLSATLFCRDGDVVGTPEYMSPEQVRSVHDVDIRSDLYSLGCTLYFALTGRPPFEGETSQQTIALAQEGSTQPMRALRSKVPGNVADVVQRLMARNPAHRFQTPAELVEALTYPVASAWLGERVEPTTVAESVPTTPTAIKTVATTATPAEPNAFATEEKRRLWCEWRNVIETLVTGDCTQIEGQAYKSIQRALVKAVRGDTGVYERVHSLVEPWLSLRVLAELDRKSLRGLWHTCRQLDAELMPSPPQPRRRLVGVVVAAMVALATAAAVWSAATH